MKAFANGKIVNNKRLYNVIMEIGKYKIQSKDTLCSNNFVSSQMVFKASVCFL